MAVTPVHRTVVGLDDPGQRVEVEGLEGARRVEVVRGVADEELVADEEDVGLDAAEAVVEGVEEGPRMLVVVVGVGPPQRTGAVPLAVGPGAADGRGERRRDRGAEGGEGSATSDEGHVLPPCGAGRNHREYGALRPSMNLYMPGVGRTAAARSLLPRRRTEKPAPGGAGFTGVHRVTLKVPGGRRVRPTGRDARPPCRRRSSRPWPA